MKNSIILNGLGLLGLAVIFSSCKEEVLPTITTAPVTNIAMTSATSGGAITDEGSGGINAKGVCWATVTMPTIADRKTNDGSDSGSYTSNMTDLIGGTTYHVRAFATNKAGTSYGNEETFTTSPSISQQGGQIIADHTVVDKYDDIPQYYIDKVKEMWLVIAGESHSRGYFSGLELLETSNAAYQVNWTQSGTPEAYTTNHLRTSRGTWGDVDTPTGWVYLYGEEDWWTTPEAIAQTKAGIKYCNTHGLGISVIGFGHCYDDGVNYTDYCTATDDYIAYCTANGYSTKVIFTTNVVDGYSSLKQYNRSLGADLIRAHVKADEKLILFDYADILCYDDGSEVMNTATYSGHTFQLISDNNRNPEEDYHISEAGAIRLAKAMWWMLARIAGWDGN
jgi:hypothetical protein